MDAAGAGLVAFPGSSKFFKAPTMAHQRSHPWGLGSD